MSTCHCKSLITCKYCHEHTDDLKMCAGCRAWLCGRCQQNHSAFRDVNDVLAWRFAGNSSRMVSEDGVHFREA